MGRMVKNVEVSESPAWLKEKLNAIGQKSINNIVDAANFMMFDLGQPIHCFDLDKLESAKIIVRNAIAGEEINLLGIEKIGNLQKSRSVLLSQNDLVIADEKGPLAIAGIKGGTKAEVDNNTKNIVIEVANFNSVTTRKTAKKLNILTDAVKRYENEISPELCTKVMDAITDLVFELGGGEVEDTIDKYPKKVEQKKVSVSINYINKRLGASFSKAEMESVWKKLNFTYIVKDGDFEIEIPYLRIDLTGPHDLVEEVIRILGYDRLEEKLPEIKLESKMNETYSKMFLARNKLLGEGYSEVMTYTFRDKGEVEVLASASDKKFLRTNLSDGLRESLKLNQLNAPLLGMKEIKIFEIGTIFKKGGEEMCVAYGDKKGIKEMKLNEYAESAKLFLNGLAGVGDPENRGPEKMTLPMKFKMWSLFPFIARDIAVWVPENILSEEVEKIIKENAGDMVVRGPELFDEFKKEGQISYAFRLVFQSFESTLTDQEINDVMTKVSDKLKERDWQVR